MASSDDCKVLLDTDARVTAFGAGPWKRLSKRTAPDGVERLFQNRAGTCFVRVLEDATGLRVDKVGADLASLSASPSAAPPTSALDAQGRLCTNRSSDPAAMAAAAAFIDRLAEGETDLDARAGGVALANRFLFGVFGGVTGMGPPWVESGEEGVLVLITPDIDWDGDSPLPIEALFPNPDDVESPNESSEFLIYNQPDVYAAVRLLLDAGFVWDQQSQSAVEEGHTPLPGLADWLRQGAPPRPKVKPAKRRTPAAATVAPTVDVSSQAELDVQVGRAQGVIVVLCDARQPLPPGFWADSEVLCHHASQPSPLLRQFPGMFPPDKPWVVVRVQEDSPLGQSLRARPDGFAQPGPQLGLIRQGRLSHAREAQGTLVTRWEILMQNLPPTPRLPSL